MKQKDKDVFVDLLSKWRKREAKPKDYVNLISFIDSLLQEDKWIPVETELPKEHTDCTIKLINDRGYKIGFYDKIYKRWYEKIYLQEKPQVITIKIVGWKYC